MLVTIAGRECAHVLTDDLYLSPQYDSHRSHAMAYLVDKVLSHALLQYNNKLWFCQSFVGLIHEANVGIALKRIKEQDGESVVW